MIPIFLDPARVRVALIGRGELAVRRLAWLRAGGAEPEIWSDAPSPALRDAAGAALNPGLPANHVLARYGAVWIADLAHAEAEALSAAAAEANVLANVEDVTALCSFHTPAVVRRGALALAAGTGGASPYVARAARERLETTFSGLWEAALDEIAAARADLRAKGANAAALAADARARLQARGLV